MESRHDTQAPSASDGATARTDAHTSTGDQSSDEPVRDYRGTGIIWTAVALVAAIALLVIVAFQNTQDVEFTFLWFDASTPLSLILVITFGIALVIGEVIGFVWRHRRRTRLRERDELRRLRSQST